MLVSYSAASKWIRDAKPGEELIYCSGEEMKRDSATSRMLRRFYDEGKIELYQRRARGGFDYIAFKRREAARVPREYQFASYPKRALTAC